MNGSNFSIQEIIGTQSNYDSFVFLVSNLVLYLPKDNPTVLSDADTCSIDRG